MTVEDYGTGIPGELLDVPAQTPGFLVAEALADPLEGELALTNKPEGGLKVSLQFEKSETSGSSQAHRIPELY